MEQAILPVVSTRGSVQYRPVIPHDQHVLLPWMAVDELIAGLPPMKFKQKRCAVRIRHAIDTNDVSNASEDAYVPGFGMGSQDGVELCCVGIIGRPDVH